LETLRMTTRLGERHRTAAHFRPQDFGRRPAPYAGPMLSNGRRAEMGVVGPIMAAVGPILSRLIWPAAIIGGGFLVAPKLAPSLGVDLESLKHSVLLGGAGAAAFAATPLLPEPVRPLATIAGIAGLAGSLLVLLAPAAEATGAAPPPAPTFQPGVAPAGQEVPVPPVGLQQILAVQMDPRQARTGGLVRTVFGSQDYEFVVRNTDRSPRTFFAGLAVYDDNQRELFRSFPDLSPWGRIQITVPPARGGVPGEAVGKLTAPAVVVFPQAVTVEVEGFRTLNEAGPFMRSESIPIRMATVGLEE
jgi:hypothetical protein